MNHEPPRHRYHEKPKERIVYAAKYRVGEPLTALIEVARHRSRDARVVEVPQYRIAVVHYTIDQYGWPEEKYLVVKANRFLTYSVDTHSVDTLDEAYFNRTYELYKGPEE